MHYSVQTLIHKVNIYIGNTQLLYSTFSPIICIWRMIHSNSGNKWCSILPSDLYLGYNTFGVYLCICVGNMFFFLSMDVNMFLSIDIWSVFQQNVNKNIEVQKTKCWFRFWKTRISLWFNLQCRPDFCWFLPYFWLLSLAAYSYVAVELFSMIESFHICLSRSNRLNLTSSVSLSNFRSVLLKFHLISRCWIVIRSSIVTRIWIVIRISIVVVIAKQKWWICWILLLFIIDMRKMIDVFAMCMCAAHDLVVWFHGLTVLGVQVLRNLHHR